MNFNTALKLITSIKSNIDEDIKYSYDLSNINKYRLTMMGSDGEKRYLKFKMKKEIKRKIYVTFVCEDFRINFPLLKQVERFKFDIYDFIMMLKYGIKCDNISINGDLDVEF